MNVIFLDAALDDLFDAVAFFETKSEGLGSRFYRCVEKTIESILDNPRLFGVIRKGYRIALISRFRKYGILFRIKGGMIFVHGIFYLSRGPRFWKTRLK